MRPRASGPGLRRGRTPSPTLRGASYLAAHTTSTVLTTPLTP